MILAVALFALYKEHLVGAWRWIYVITAVVSLYLNVFVLVVQSFVKVSALNALAPDDRMRYRSAFQTHIPSSGELS